MLTACHCFNICFLASCFRVLSKWDEEKKAVSVIIRRCSNLQPRTDGEEAATSVSQELKHLKSSILNRGRGLRCHDSKLETRPTWKRYHYPIDQLHAFRDDRPASQPAMNPQVQPRNGHQFGGRETRKTKILGRIR